MKHDANEDDYRISPKHTLYEGKLKLKRGQSMNRWERWLSDIFDDVPVGLVIKQKLLVKELSRCTNPRDIKKRQGKVVVVPDDYSNIIRNSIRRFVRHEWLKRVKPGSFILTDKALALRRYKRTVGRILEAERRARDLSRKDISILLDHRGITRVTLFETGRVAAKVWEAHALLCFFGIDSGFLDAVHALVDPDDGPEKSE